MNKYCVNGFKFKLKKFLGTKLIKDFRVCVLDVAYEVERIISSICVRGKSVLHHLLISECL